MDELKTLDSIAFEMFGKPYDMLDDAEKEKVEQSMVKLKNVG
jgi:hypothetical protein